MSEIREVSVEYGRTVNLGNFESERLQIGLTATVADGEDDLDVAHGLVKQARVIASDWLARFRRERLGRREEGP